MTNKMKINTLLAGALALSSLGAISAANANEMGKAAGTEHCYGVVKAGMNDCGSADKAHSCAAQATTDASGVEFISVPEGLCEKLVNGSLTPVTAEGEAAPEAAPMEAEH